MIVEEVEHLLRLLSKVSDGKSPLEAFKRVYDFLVGFAGYFAFAFMALYVGLSVVGISGHSSVWISMGIGVMLILVQDVARNVRPRKTTFKAGLQQPLCDQLQNDIKGRSPGKAVFYHYSGRYAFPLIQEFCGRG